MARKLSVGMIVHFKDWTKSHVPCQAAICTEVIGDGSAWFRVLAPRPNSGGDLNAYCLYANPALHHDISYSQTWHLPSDHQYLRGGVIEADPGVVPV